MSSDAPTSTGSPGPVMRWSLGQLADDGLRELTAGLRSGAGLHEGRLVRPQAMPADGTSTSMVVGVSALPSHYETPSHQHEAEELAIVVSGEGVITVDGEEFPVTVGDVLLTPPNLPHVTQSLSSPLVVLWVYAPPGSERRWVSAEREHDAADNR